MSLAHGRDKAKIALIENGSGESSTSSRESGVFPRVSVYALSMDLNFILIAIVVFTALHSMMLSKRLDQLQSMWDDQHYSDIEAYREMYDRLRTVENILGVKN